MENESLHQEAEEEKKIITPRFASSLESLAGELDFNFLAIDSSLHAFFNTSNVGGFY